MREQNSLCSSIKKATNAISELAWDPLKTTDTGAEADEGYVFASFEPETASHLRLDLVHFVKPSQRLGIHKRHFGQRGSDLAAPSGMAKTGAETDQAQMFEIVESESQTASLTCASIRFNHSNHHDCGNTNAMLGGAE
jgi:hypothetical protein